MRLWPTPAERAAVAFFSGTLLHMRRAATRDNIIRDAEIKASDKVVLWCICGNRDEEVFEDPFAFDVLRNPNPHIAFGGGGAHFCQAPHPPAPR